MAPDVLTVLQWKATYPRVNMQHKLVLMNLFYIMMQLGGQGRERGPRRRLWGGSEYDQNK